MDLMYIRHDANGHYLDAGYLTRYDVAFDITTDLEYLTNEFELTMTLPDCAEDLLWSENGNSTMIFAEGTEFGGIITGSETNLDSNEITYSGWTWRGMLQNYIIEPPAGQAYLTVSGNLADIINSLPMPSYMEAAATTYTTASYQFNRYVTTYKGVTQLLASVNPSLRLSFSFESNADSGTVTINIVEARDLTDLIELSQDYGRIALQITYDSTTPRHLICLGAGELQEREVIHLYADSDWNISQTPVANAYPTETYDYSSSSDLLADGIKHFEELIANHEQIEVSIDGLGVQLSDIIAAKDNLTGEAVTAEITSIIYRCSDRGTHQTESFEYKTKIIKALPDTANIPEEVSVTQTQTSGDEIGSITVGSTTTTLYSKKYPVLPVSIASFSSLPQTVTNSKITADMVCVKTELGTPSAQAGDWTVTTSAGSLTISGSISGSTTATLYLAREEN